MEKTQVVIIGGGLAGLCASIQLAKKGLDVILLEKETWPHHKVCGEYISNESLPFLIQLGIPFQTLALPQINTLKVSTPSGYSISHPLQLGGFGISRYKLDHLLSELASKQGVQLFTGENVESCLYQESTDDFLVHTRSGKTIQAPIAIGAFGKRSNLDLKLNRNFAINKPGRLDQFIAVKYHVANGPKSNTIELHNFKDGYCGYSQIEDNKACLCYLTTARNLSEHKSIQNMEQNVLFKNPHLKHIFSANQFLYNKPLSISQVSFSEKKLVEQHLLMAGDSAGLITPLCGNGMSMAMHASVLLAQEIESYFQHNNRNQMEQQYTSKWNDTFKTRLKIGAFIQGTFGKPIVSELFVKSLAPFPKIINLLVSKTHGQAF
jgi:flavin-dependent dehydrogenase